MQWEWDIQMINKKQLFNKIEGPIVNPNSCKYLSSDSNRRFTIYFRDRQPENTYFLITIKGNYLRAYQINWLNEEGHSINTFLEFNIPSILGHKPKLPKRHCALILKKPFKEYKAFITEFREKT